MLKFFAYLKNRSEFDGAVRDFLNRFMEKHRDGADVTTWRHEFDGAVDALWGVFGGPVLKSNYALTPVNQFEALMVAAAELIAEGKPVQGDPATVMNDPELVRHSTKGTNTPAALRSRIERAKALLGE